jgi:hypothetical protein
MARNIRQAADYLPHPIVVSLADIARLDPRTHEKLAEIDGISSATWRSWMTRTHSPGIALLSARAATFGYKIIIVPDTQP